MGSRGLQASATAEMGLDILVLEPWTQICLNIDHMTPSTQACVTQVHCLKCTRLPRACVICTLTTGQHLSNVCMTCTDISEMIECTHDFALHSVLAIHGAVAVTFYL